MSTAGARSTMPWTRSFSPRSPRRRARSSAIHPPIDDPTRICGPFVAKSNTASASSSQREIVPSSNRPPDFRGRNSRSGCGATLAARPSVERLRLAARHVGAKTAEPEDAGRLSLPPKHRDRLATRRPRRRRDVSIVPRSSYCFRPNLPKAPRCGNSLNVVKRAAIACSTHAGRYGAPGRPRARHGRRRACDDRYCGGACRRGDRALVASAGGRLEADLADAGGALLRLPVGSKNPAVMAVALRASPPSSAAEQRRSRACAKPRPGLVGAPRLPPDGHALRHHLPRHLRRERLAEAPPTIR